jgi:FAD:protein FMN transferase
MKKWHYPFLLFLIIGTIIIIRQNRPVYRSNEGSVFGTSYRITYLYNKDLKKDIEETLAKVDGALSMFNDSSTISKINRNENVIPDSLFMHIYRLSVQVSDWTDGAFDITVAPAVNAWGFGFKHAENITDATIDSLKNLVGYKKIQEKDGKIIKSNPDIMLDCSAIAKGFGSDAVADMMKAKKIDNFMIEIGGEIVLKGVNSKGNKWNIGVSKPIDDSLAVSNELQTILSLTDCALATSGNYRNYYYKDGKKYAHTIDPKTCRPVSHSLLSATVIASDCATADAFATSMMVIGLDSAKVLCDKHKDIEAYFIYENTDGEITTYYTNGFQKYIKQ